jgi:hypothetical protein
MTSHAFELEAEAVKITSYRIGPAFLTEVQSRSSGAIIARGIAPTKEDSRIAAFQTAAKRMLRAQYAALMVGG